MGTRTYSRRGVNGQRVMTAEGRRRAGLEAIDILGNPVPDRAPVPASPLPAESPSWMTKAVNVTPEDRVNLMRGIGYAESEFYESLMSALETQMEYQQNPTPETYRTMLAYTGQFEAQKHKEGIFNADRLAAWEARAANLGLAPQTPPVEVPRPQNNAIFGTNSLRYMNDEYFAIYGDRVENMTTDMKEAVTELGNGNLQRGLAIMTELKTEVANANQARAQVKAKANELYQRMEQMGREVAPRVGLPPDYARSDIVRASREIVESIERIARARGQGDLETAKKLERTLKDALKVGSVPASGRGPGRRSRRGERVPTMKLNPQAAQEFIDKQVAIINREQRERRYQIVPPRPSRQSLGDYTRESIKTMASSARGSAQAGKANNEILENVLNKWRV